MGPGLGIHQESSPDWRFAAQVDSVLAGTWDRHEALTICEQTPEALLRAGIPDDPWNYTMRHLIDAITSPADVAPSASGRPTRSCHGLPVSLVRELPELLERPAAILQLDERRTLGAATGSLSNRVMVVLDSAAPEFIGRQRTGGLNPLVCVVEVGGTSYGPLGPASSNFVLSAYGRRGALARDLLQAMHAGRVLFVDAPALEDVAGRCGLEVPRSARGADGYLGRFRDPRERPTRADPRLPQARESRAKASRRERVAHGR